LSSNLLLTLFAVVFTLGLVIIVHELGHFLFCKLFGIYVKTFSIGIGPKLLRRRIGETEYALSAIPFGGYVKMAGEGVMEEIQDAGTWDQRKYPLGTEEGNREAADADLDIPPERHLNTRPAGQRLAVFVAGPLFNLLLAFLIFAWSAWQTGVVEIPVTRVGGVVPGSPAAAAGIQTGDQVLSVGGKAVAVWDDILEGLLAPNLANPQAPQPVSLRLLRNGRVRDLSLLPAYDGGQGRWRLGLEPWDTVVGLVQRGGPAAQIGLRTGDRILALNGQTVTSFAGIAEIINRSAGKQVRVLWEHDGQLKEHTVVPEAAEIQPDSLVGRIFFESRYVHRPLGLGAALGRGAQSTWWTATAVLASLTKFLTGQLSLEAVGGPIRIGQVAGEQLRWSFGRLMYFIAFFSVNLFLLNLLPIPVLDGGHVLFLLVEVVRGKPVPERIQAIATQVGLIVLLLFMTFIVVVDVLKVTGH
jgi:regulator of sigma E protease